MAQPKRLEHRVGAGRNHVGGEPSGVQFGVIRVIDKPVIFYFERAKLADESTQETDMASVTLLPVAAADRICHDEQMTIWSNDLVSAFGMSGLMPDLEYDQVVEAHQVAENELRRIIRAVLEHPEARTIMTFRAS